MPAVRLSVPTAWDCPVCGFWGWNTGKIWVRCFGSPGLADCRPEAVGGFSDRFGSYHLRVEMEERWKEKVPPEKLDALLGVLGQDPRPSYQKDPERVYGMEFAGMEIKFRVNEDVLTVCGVEMTGENQSHR